MYILTHEGDAAQVVMHDPGSLGFELGTIEASWHDIIKISRTIRLKNGGGMPLPDAQYEKIGEELRFRTNVHPYDTRVEVPVRTSHESQTAECLVTCK